MKGFIKITEEQVMRNGLSIDAAVAQARPSPAGPPVADFYVSTWAGAGKAGFRTRMSQV